VRRGAASENRENMVETIQEENKITSNAWQPALAEQYAPQSATVLLWPEGVF